MRQSGTNGDYHYENLLLRDHDGNVLPPVDGLYSLDPTHPGTLMHMEYELGNIISLSIAPIFPHGYGHARRISCDAFGSLDQSAYLNNCITYLWWMNDCLYRFNDSDHIVTYKTHDKHSITLEEGRTRYHAGVVCGCSRHNPG